MNLVMMEKLESGELQKLGERKWDASFSGMLQHANFVLVGGKEYEMVEGRLNLDLEIFELLLVAVKPGQ